MNLLDRKSPPPAQPQHHIPMPAIHLHRLSNGLNVHIVPYGSIELLELRYVVPAGVSFEATPYVAQLTSSLLSEGTRQRTGLQLARSLDELGAILDADSGYESATVGLTVLPSRMGAAIALLAEVLLEATYPADELEKLRVRTLEWLEVEEQKTEFIARRSFNNLLLGDQHPYGRVISREIVQQVQVEMLREYHARNYSPTNAFVVAVGRFDTQQLLNELEAHFGAARLIQPGLAVDRDSSQGKLPTAGGKGFHYLEKQGSLQATLRVGHLGFKRSHPDFTRLQVVTTLFGGYFGSRLMRNIREEKGYTYHIGANWSSLKHGGTFVIQTDIGNEYIDPTLQEIRNELDKLLQDGATHDELDLVRNYMMGRMVSSRETPEQVADLIVTALVNEVPFEELDKRFEVIRDISTDDVLALARQHYLPENLLEVVSGKRG